MKLEEIRELVIHELFSIKGQRTSEEANQYEEAVVFTEGPAITEIPGLVTAILKPLGFKVVTPMFHPELSRYVFARFLENRRQEFLVIHWGDKDTFNENDISVFSLSGAWHGFIKGSHIGVDLPPF